jgi:hypothetical protein
LPHGVSRWGLNPGADFLLDRIKLLLDLGLGLGVDTPPEAFAVAVKAE